MVSISQLRIKINEESVSWLKGKGVEIPENAVSFDHIFAPKFTEYTEQFTFNDRLDLRIKQQKNHVNKKTKEKDIQIREYDYTKRFYGKEKITEIRQKRIGTDGTEKAETWRFYYPKDYSSVRFSRKSGKESSDNYLKADGFITDKNGLKIRPISTAEYVDLKKDIDEKNFVASPWTIKQSITTDKPCATDSVQECTVVGIYGDKGISLNHLNPNHPDNYKFEKIEDTLLKELSQQGKNAKAFVLGSCESDTDSNKQFMNIIDFLTVFGVKHSRFKTGNNILYGPFYYDTKVTSANSKKYKYGTASPFEWQSGHHIVYDNGELKIANTVIDSELKKGNTDPESLIKKSFYRVYK